MWPPARWRILVLSFPDDLLFDSRLNSTVAQVIRWTAIWRKQELEAMATRAVQSAAAVLNTRRSHRS
jgi:hypothetical protein